jgi:hypothetical protein
MKPPFFDMMFPPIENRRSLSLGDPHAVLDKLDPS